MEQPCLLPLDACDGVAGLEMPARLLWEAYVRRQEISHPAGWETGRPSEPDYMDMNLHSARKVEPAQPRVVVFQYDALRPLNPRGLLVAYEEHGRVQPVASDFDAFLIGSRGLPYPPTPPWQLPFLSSMVMHVEEVRGLTFSIDGTQKEPSEEADPPHVILDRPEYDLCFGRYSPRPTSAPGRTDGSRYSRAKLRCARPLLARSARSGRMAHTALGTRRREASSNASCTSRPSTTPMAPSATPPSASTTISRRCGASTRDEAACACPPI